MLSTMPLWCIMSPVTRNLELILLTLLHSNRSYTADLLLTVLLAFWDSDNSLHIPVYLD